LGPWFRALYSNCTSIFTHRRSSLFPPDDMFEPLG
jgi:hypothetical protein